MDEEAVGLIGWIIIAVVGLIGAIGITGGVLYASDAAIGAVVIEKDCASPLTGGPADSAITVETRFPVPGVQHTLTDFDDQKCTVIEEGKTYAEYHLKSGHTIVYREEGGPCLYDSEKGPGC